jgi:hypothetical protein
MTLIELGIVIAVITLVVVVLLLAIDDGNHRGGARRLKDSTQLRGIQQAVAVWAQSNADEFPLPSRADKANDTVSEQGREKDTTANIFSLLVFNGSISPELLSSPLENNRAIRVFETYEYDRPKAAVDPIRALWDPALSADFTSAGGGHISYALALPNDARLQAWTGVGSKAVDPTLPVISNRGPLTVRGSDGGLESDRKSNTLRFFGSSKLWRGNAAFNDNHVDFLTTPVVTADQTTGGASRPDHLFFDEPEDAKGTNAFLGIFIKAGPVPRDFKSIWD